jgi:putative two-component system response regulator
MILIVDDHIDTGTILARMLKRCGHDAVAVSSGAAALQWLEIARPSVMILDMMMPEMHGLEVLQRVRADARQKDVPVIIYSADHSPRVEEQARDGGAQEFVVKGVVPWDRLCAMITRYATA